MTQRLTPYQRALIANNRGLAVKLAMLAWNKNRNQDGDELISVAYQGLTTAAILFDPNRQDIDPDDLENGRAFSGYARQRINGSLLDWQRKGDFVPKRVRKSYKDLQAIGHGEGATVRDLAVATGLPEVSIRKVVAAVESMPVSLDSAISPESDEKSSPSSIYYVASEADVEGDSTVSLVLREMASTWAALPFLQRAAVANRFYFGKSVSKTAEALGCTSAEAKGALAAGMGAMLDALRSSASSR